MHFSKQNAISHADCLWKHQINCLKYYQTDGTQTRRLYTLYTVWDADAWLKYRAKVACTIHRDSVISMTQRFLNAGYPPRCIRVNALLTHIHNTPIQTTSITVDYLSLYHIDLLIELTFYIPCTRHSIDHFRDVVPSQSLRW